MASLDLNHSFVIFSFVHIILCLFIFLYLKKNTFKTTALKAYNIGLGVIVLSGVAFVFSYAVNKAIALYVSDILLLIGSVTMMLSIGVWGGKLSKKQFYMYSGVAVVVASVSLLFISGTENAKNATVLTLLGATILYGAYSLFSLRNAFSYSHLPRTMFSLIGTVLLIFAIVLFINVEEVMLVVSEVVGVIKYASVFIATLFIGVVLLVWNKEEKEKCLEVKQQYTLLEKEKLQKKLENKDKMFSVISHDLRGSIGLVRNMSELFLETHNELTGKEREDYINVLFNSSKDTYELLNNLLEWSRVKTGLAKAQPVKIDLQTLVDEVIGQMQEQADVKKIWLVNSVPANVFLYADYNMLSSIMRNLISNAIKFTQTSGMVMVFAIYQETGKYKIYVKDTGIGMEKEKAENLFASDAIYSTKGTYEENGSGIGLKICKEFVEQNNGRIWVESKTNEGCTFCFTIPKGEDK